MPPTTLVIFFESDNLSARIVLSGCTFGVITVAQRRGTRVSRQPNHGILLLSQRPRLLQRIFSRPQGTGTGFADDDHALIMGDEVSPSQQRNAHGLKIVR